MNMYELCTRNAISRTATKLLKKKKITQKQIIIKLHTTRERYVKYALKGFPTEDLETILQLLEIDIFEFMNLVDLDIREFNDNNISPITTEQHYADKSMTKQEALYHKIKETWLSLNPDTIILLDAWLKENSVYYLYLQIVKQTFLTQDDLNLINKHQINLINYAIFQYYNLKHEEIEAIYEHGVHDVYMYLIMKQLLAFYKKHSTQKDRSSLPVLIKLAEKTLL